MENTENISKQRSRLRGETASEQPVKASAKQDIRGNQKTGYAMGQRQKPTNS